MKIYIGIDFAKRKFDVCYLDEDGIVAHAEFKNQKSDFKKLISWIKKTAGLHRRNLNPESVLFCGEHTGECSMALCEWLYSNGYRIWLASALAIKRNSGIARGKSDKADAERIAIYAMEKYKPSETRLFVPDTASVKELKSLYFARAELVKIRVGVGNRIASGSFNHSKDSLKSLREFHKNLQIKEDLLEQKMEQFALSSSELCDNFKILRSFSGIGVLTAVFFLIFTSNFTRFDNPRKFACQCGVAPFGQDSGDSIHVHPHVSLYAHRQAKAALVQAAMVAIRYNPGIREYAARLERKGKHRGIILNNVKNKIIHTVFKMIANKSLWDKDYAKSHMSGNQSHRSLGVKKQKGAAEATPSADMSVQTSPSVFGGKQIYEKPRKNSNLSKNSCQKTCVET